MIILTWIVENYYNDFKNIFLIISDKYKCRLYFGVDRVIDSPTLLPSKTTLLRQLPGANQCYSCRQTNFKNLAEQFKTLPWNPRPLIGA